MKSSFWNKAGSLLCCVGLLAAILAGCTVDDPVTGAMVETLTVQVESVQENSVTAVVGALQQQTAAPGDSMGEPPSGDMGTPPDGSMGEPPSGDMGSGTPPDGMGGGQALEFVASPDVGAITFTITDSTAITVEFLQGSQEGTIDDIVVDAVLEVSLDAYDNATDIVVKNLSAGGSDTVTNGTAVTTFTKDGTYSGDIYTATGDDENALRVGGAAMN